MSIIPIITFKAGICDLDLSATPPKVNPRLTPGYIYLYSEDDLVHFCWRPRSASMNSPELDLVMVPTDGSFKPYNNGGAKPKVNGRIFTLKFTSSSQRYLFWLQSKAQSPTGDASHFSERDLRLGNIVDSLLQGEEVDVPSVIAEIHDSNRRGNDDDEDESMEDIEGTGDPLSHHRGGSGGAGPGATGGDIREEGEGSREGGADGGRAATLSSSSNAAAPTSGQASTSAVVQNFLNSLGAIPAPSGNSRPAQHQGSALQDSPFPSLPELLPSTTTISLIDSAPATLLDVLIAHLPPQLIELASFLPTASLPSSTSPAHSQTLSIEQKRDLLRRVLRSPQYSQALVSLTVALRDGGLAGVSEALKVKVQNVNVAGGHAVEAFVHGVKRGVEEEQGGLKTRDTKNEETTGSVDEDMGLE